MGGKQVGRWMTGWVERLGWMGGRWMGGRWMGGDGWGGDGWGGDGWGGDGWGVRKIRRKASEGMGHKWFVRKGIS